MAHACRVIVHTSAIRSAGVIAAISGSSSGSDKRRRRVGYRDRSTTAVYQYRPHLATMVPAEW